MPHTSLKRLSLIADSLAFGAGLVNSVALLAFGGAVSHMSGHATHAAIEMSENHSGAAVAFGLAVLFFIAGAAFTSVLLRGRFLNSDRIHAISPLLIEAALIAYVAYRATRVAENFGSLADARFVFILTFAMGMQNALLRRAAGIIIRTTHMTGVATDIGIAIGWLVSAVLDALASKIGIVSASAHKSFSEDMREKFNLKTFALHVGLFFSFGVGAVAGTFGYLRSDFRVLAVPIVILVANAVAELIQYGRTRRFHMVSR